MILLGITAWLLVGFAGFVFWWTSEWDLTASDTLMALGMGGPLGPLAWLVGWRIHGRSRTRPHGRNPFGGRVLVHCRWRP